MSAPRGRSAAQEEEDDEENKARKRRRSKSPFDPVNEPDVVIIVEDEQERDDGVAVAAPPVVVPPVVTPSPPLPAVTAPASSMTKEELQELEIAKQDLRAYWDRSFEEMDTIDRIREGEKRNMDKRREIPFLAELVGVDMAADARDVNNRARWVYKLKNPLVEAYVNIGRSHDHYIYPLHVDLASATRSNIISRLHASLRFDLETLTWMVQVFGRNGVEFPSHGWVMPAECDEEVWRGLRGYNNYKFTIGEVEFHIFRNPVFSSEKQMADWCRRLEGQADSESNSSNKQSSPVDRTLVDCFLDSAEEDDDGKDHEIQLEFARTKVSSVPPRGTTGQENPDMKVIEDGDELSVLNLLVRYPLPTERELSGGGAAAGVLKKARLRQGETAANGKKAGDEKMVDLADEEDVEVVVEGREDEEEEEEEEEEADNDDEEEEYSNYSDEVF